MTYEELESRARAWHDSRMGEVVDLDAALAKLYEEVAALTRAIDDTARVHAIEGCADCILALYRLLQGLHVSPHLAVLDRLAVLEQGPLPVCSMRARRWLNHIDEPRQEVTT